MHTVPGLFDRLVKLYADGEQATAEGRFADAIELFSEGIALDDHFRQRYVTLYAQRAFAKRRMGDLAGAIPDYGVAIAMEPAFNQARYYFHRGICFATLGEHAAEAVADFTRSLAIDDRQPGPYHLRGKLLTTELGQHDAAITDFDRSLALHVHPEVLQLRGRANLELGRAQLAIADLHEAKRLLPDVYTDYLLAWAGAIAPDDELFYSALSDVLRADPSYREHFLDNDDFRRFYEEPRFQQIVGPG